MRTRKKTLAAAGSLSALALVLAGCGDDGGSGGGSGDLEGVSVTVGSKDFTENILLGEMMVQALEANGASVDNKTNTGGTEVARKALTSGDIDVYPEYNGTGWTVHLGQENPSQDPEELFNVTSEMDLKENDIKWVGLSPFGSSGAQRLIDSVNADGARFAASAASAARHHPLRMVLLVPLADAVTLPVCPLPPSKRGAPPVGPWPRLRARPGGGPSSTACSAPSGAAERRSVGSTDVRRPRRAAETGVSSPVD